MRRIAVFPLLLFALPGSAVASVAGDNERIFYAVRAENGTILWEQNQSEDQCIDVYGRTPDIEDIIPADGERHRISAAVRESDGPKVHPPTYSSIADAPGISSSAYVMVRGQQRFLECSVDTIYVLERVRRLPEQ